MEIEISNIGVLRNPVVRETEEGTQTMSQEALRDIALQVRNWGKWGPDDEPSGSLPVTKAVGTPINPYALK